MSAATSIADRGPAGPSVAELQAAYRAASRGEFAAAAHGEDRDRSTRCPLALPAGAVAVAAAQPGGGASTVALAVADAIGQHATVRLVEWADPARSGLAPASSSELGTDQQGWRHGRRGAQVTITRPAVIVAELAAPIPTRAGERLLVDLGWQTAVDLSRLAATGHARLLLVGRASVPGLRHAEQALAALTDHHDPPPPPVLAMLGPVRWPGLLTASCGPQVAAARQAGRLVPVPTDRHLEQAGLTADPLPRPLLAAGRALAALLFDDLTSPAAAPGRKRLARRAGPHPTPNDPASNPEQEGPVE